MFKVGLFHHKALGLQFFYVKDSSRTQDESFIWSKWNFVQMNSQV